jgi:3-hydroxyisobutyrate dehydrogenase-like beta-hydroxyacid dehydrogenase
MKNIGLVGVGTMGEPMGASLLRHGYSLCVCAHRTRDRVERLVAAGATEAGDPASVAERCDVLITMVPDAPEVEEALFGPRGAVHGLKRGCYVIEMSTISPVASREFHARLADQGIGMLDAPVSGGPARAATGELTIMAGGERAAFEACEPVLRAMGKPIHVGGPGMGETVKLVNQIIISSVMIANVEGLMFAKKAGADIDIVRAVLATATASNYVLDKWLPQTWFAGKRSGGFALDLLRKDLNAALDAARRMGLALPASGLSYQLFTAASGSGHGREDYSAVSAVYEELAGVRVVEEAV